MKCHRCKEADDTPWHALWECPCLEQHKDKTILDTNWMKKLFMGSGEFEGCECECLWGRAILPAKDGKEYDCNCMDSGWAGVEVDTTRKSLNFDSLFGTTEEVGTDGSGGPQWVPKEIKKVAAAVSVVDMSKHEGHITVNAAALLTSGIPGKQTVPEPRQQQAST